MNLHALAYWVHDLSPFAIRFSESFGIRWYGLAYICAFISAAWLLMRYDRAGRSVLPAAKVPDLMTYLVVGVVLGGRLGFYFLYEAWRGFMDDPLALLRVWEGGMSFHGGIAGVAIAIILFARFQALSYRQLGDLVATVAPVGLFFGRLANFVNGELWGKVTTVPWAVIFPQSVPPGVPLEHIAPRHPSQLYEAVLEGLLLTVFVQWRFWRTHAARAFPARIAAECVLFYALARILCEVFREPDTSLIGFLGMSFSRGTFYSFFLLLGAAVLWRISCRPLPSSLSKTDGGNTSPKA